MIQVILCCKFGKLTFMELIYVVLIQIKNLLLKDRPEVGSIIFLYGWVHR